MSTSAQIAKVKQNETEIAILQVQVSNLDEKIDDIKSDLKEMRTHMSKGAEDTQKLLKEFQVSNSEQHDIMGKKVATLERWRWTIAGACLLAGALGFDTLAKLLR